MSKHLENCEQDM